jgi:WD40 repeat protein
MHRVRSELENNNVRAARALLDLYRPGAGTKARPGWEWYYWDRVCHAELATLKMPSGRVRSLAYSPDGAMLVAAGSGGVQIWDTRSGEELRAPPCSKERAVQVVFSPGGKILAVCAKGEVKLWDTATWDVLPGWKQESADGASYVSFSPDGKTVAVSDLKSKRVKFWDLAGKKWAGMLPEGTASRPPPYSGTALSLVQYSLDGRLLAVVRENGVQLWDVTRQALVRTLRGHLFVNLEAASYTSEAITGLAFSPDGQLLATCSQDGTVKLRKVSDGTEVRSITVVAALAEN